MGCPNQRMIWTILENVRALIALGRKDSLSRILFSRPTHDYLVLRDALNKTTDKMKKKKI